MCKPEPKHMPAQTDSEDKSRTFGGPNLVFQPHTEPSILTWNWPERPQNLDWASIHTANGWTAQGEPVSETAALSMSVLPDICPENWPRNQSAQIALSSGNRRLPREIVQSMRLRSGIVLECHQVEPECLFLPLHCDRLWEHWWGIAWLVVFGLRDHGLLRGLLRVSEILPLVSSVPSCVEQNKSTFLI